MRSIFTLFACLLFSSLFAQINIDVRDLGAVGDNSTVNTSFIQLAIDSVSNAGGGEVQVISGTYITSTIILKSNVTLRVAPDAVLKAMPDNNDYPDIPYSSAGWSKKYTKKSLIFAEYANNIRITGGGEINGNGQGFAYLQVTKDLRPFGLRISNCDSVRIDSILLQNAPHWMAHVKDCNHVHIYNTEIYNHGFGSNDGFDIDGCTDVLIEDCKFDSNDDPIAIKTHNYNVCRDVTVRRCTIATFERGVKVGNESLGPFINIRFEDINIIDSEFILPLPSSTAIYLAIADGGSADSIYFERISIEEPYNTPIFIRLCNRGNKWDTAAPAPPVQYLRNVWIKDVYASADGTIPCSVTGIPGYPVQNVHLENISLNVPGNGPAGNTTQPELETTRPENDIWGNTLPAYGLYVRHVDGLELDSFCVFASQPEQRTLYYFEDSSNISILNECSFAPNGIEDESVNTAIIYPNPAHDKVQINNIPAGIEALMLTNSVGQTVYVMPVNNYNNVTINTSTLPGGVYFVTLAGKNQRQVVKVMVQ